MKRRRGISWLIICKLNIIFILPICSIYCYMTWIANWLGWLCSGYGWNYFVETMFCPSDFQICNITILQTNQQTVQCSVETVTDVYYCSQRGTRDHWLARYSSTTTIPPVVSQNTASRSESPGRGGSRRDLKIGAFTGRRTTSEEGEERPSLGGAAFIVHPFM